MATATVIKTVEVTLVLSDEETRALKRYLNYCGTDPCGERLRDKVLYDIDNALKAV